MSKVAVVYWSGTGHTQAMAEAVAKAAGADLITAAEFGPDQVAAYDAIAFGCPAMGAEVLEEEEFRAVRFLRLGRRGLDALLGGGLPGRGRGSGLRERHLPGRAQRRRAGRLREAGRGAEIIFQNH